MVKTAAQVKAKMTERVASAGRYLTEGMNSAEDPTAKLAANPDMYAAKLKAGLDESIRRGSYQAGVKKAAADGTWKKSTARAGRHFEERTADMVDNSMKTYDQRAACIEEAKSKTAAMPTTTRQNRIAKAGAHAEFVGQCMDKLFGRK